MGNIILRQVLHNLYSMSFLISVQLAFNSFINFSAWISKRLELLKKGPKASLVAQMVKCLPSMWDTWVQSLGREDPLEKEMATHSSTLARKTPWTEEPGMLQCMVSQRVGHN